MLPMAVVNLRQGFANRNGVVLGYGKERRLRRHCNKTREQCIHYCESSSRESGAPQCLQEAAPGRLYLSQALQRPSLEVFSDPVPS